MPFIEVPGEFELDSIEPTTPQKRFVEVPGEFELDPVEEIAPVKTNRYVEVPGDFELDPVSQSEILTPRPQQPQQPSIEEPKFPQPSTLRGHPIPELRAAPEPTFVETATKTITDLFGIKAPEGMDPEIGVRAQIELEAKKAGLPFEEYVGKVNPEAIPLKRAERFLSGIGQGAVGTIGSMLGAVDWLADSDVARDLNNKAKIWISERAPRSPDFADAVASGIGSAAVFWIPGFGVQSGLTGLGLVRVAPRLAKWGGVAVSTALESMVEAGSTYSSVLSETGDKEKANRAATKVMVANLPLIAVTNRLGVFGEKGGQIRKHLTSGLMEAGQEAGQEVISAVAEGRPIKPTRVATAGGVGFITGSAVKGLEMGVEALEAGPLPTPPTIGPVRAEPAIPIEEKPIDLVQERIRNISRSPDLTLAQKTQQITDLKERAITQETIPEADIPTEAAIEQEEFDKILTAIGRKPIATEAPVPGLADILKSEKGVLPLEPLAAGIKLTQVQATQYINTINKTFTRFTGLPEETRQELINIAEGDIELREGAAKTAVDLTKQFDDQTLENLADHLERPTRFAAPLGTEKLAAQLKALGKYSLFELNKRGFESEKDIEALKIAIAKDQPIPENLKARMQVPKWPDNEIDRLSNKRDQLEFKYGNTESNEALAKIEEETKNIEERIKELHDIRYLHRITSKKDVSRSFSQRYKSIFKAKPQELLGRKFATRAEAKAEGRDIGSLPASMAEVLYNVNRTKRLDTFIKGVNRNPEFSMRADLAPKDWRSIDVRGFPSGRGRKYSPAIADAIEELSEVNIKAPLVRTYDKINTALKIVGFYNPLFMARFNVSQGIRAVGPRWLDPRVHKKVWKLYKEKGDTYNYLRRNGLFNNVFDIKPAMTDLTDNLREAVRDAPGVPEKAKRIFIENLNPVNLIKNSWNVLNKGTWKIDEYQRMVTWEIMKNNPHLKKKYSDFQIVELANDFHANYGKIPKKTRETLNRVIFTPSYKISMMRIVGRMHQETLKSAAKGEVSPLAPALIRHYAMKIFFNKYLPLAIAAYLKWKGVDKRVRVEGYRVIVTDPRTGKETVYSISDPLLEGTKILNRAFNRTIAYNLAALPSAAAQFIFGPLFRKKIYRGKPPQWQEIVDIFFKTGAPIIKELALWKDKSFETYQKFMQLLGLAFIYKRNKTELPEQGAVENFMRAMDLWVDWQKIKPTWGKTTKEKPAAGTATEIEF